MHQTEPMYGSIDMSQQPRLQKELYLKVLENFPALIWRSGTDGLCDWFNSTWLDFTGRSLEQEAGNGWAEGVHPEDLQGCIQCYTEHFNLHKPFRMEYRLMHNSGEYRWILDLGRPFFDLDNTFRGYIGSCYDISEEHRMIAELKALGEFRDTLFAIIGHDLKNHLSAIGSLTELMLLDKGPGAADTAREYLGVIHEASENSVNLLTDLMSWAHARLGSVVPQPSCQQVLELVDIVKTQVSGLMQAKEISLELDCKQDFTVHADGDMVATVLRNLWINAIKYSKRQGTIFLSVGNFDHRISIKIQDTGMGMGTSTLQALQSGLANVRSTPGTEQERGTGLGLMLSRELLKLNNGSLLIDSIQGQGSTFTVLLPSVFALH